MTELEKKKLGKSLRSIANQLLVVMNADDFRNCMLSFLFLRCLSENYEVVAKKILFVDYPELENDDRWQSLADWYGENADSIEKFEARMRQKLYYAIKPSYLWSSIVEMARIEDIALLNTLKTGFKFIENEAFTSKFDGLFIKINLYFERLGGDYAERNKKLCKIIQAIADGFADFPTDKDILGDVYEYLIGQFAAGIGMKANEFYTPPGVSTILSTIVTLDSQIPSSGKKNYIESVFDFACGSGSLLLNVRNRVGRCGIGKIYGQECNIATWNIARMNMLVHGVKDTDFEIFHGDSLLSDWDVLLEASLTKMARFDAVVANPPYSHRWDPSEALGEDPRFKNYGLAPKSVADFAFLLHGFHYLKQEGTMAILLHNGVLFRGGAEERMRAKLLKDGHIDAVIGLPANLLFTTGIPVCILVLKKSKKYDDVLFINAAKHFERGKRQSRLTEKQIEKIISTYQHREGKERYSRRVEMKEIEENNFSLEIAKYVSTAEIEKEINLHATNAELARSEDRIEVAKQAHSALLKELDLPALP